MEHSNHLLTKFRNNQCTPEEIELLLQQFAGDTREDLLKQSIEENLMLTYDNSEDTMYAANARSVNEVYENIYKEIVPQRRVVKLWPRIAAVAAAVALIVLGVYFFNAPSRHSDPALSSRASRDLNDIAPGKNGATITLANGKVIQLSDAKTGVVIGDDKLAYNDGSSALSSRANAKDLNDDITAETQKGQTYIFTLPDGTKVWLNAASSLTIPSDFSGTESRTVALEGEAYFEVFKDKKRPFIVESNGQVVTVLGTHFNISAYKDESSIKTTLLEGSVRVSSSRQSAATRDLLNSTNKRSLPAVRDDVQGVEGTSIVLKPNQQSVVSGSNRIAIKDMDAQTAVAWKSGEFLFRRDDMRTVMRQIARWYDVEVVYVDEMKGKTIWGSVNKYGNISTVLDMIELTGGVKFKVEGRKVYVSK